MSAVEDTLDHCAMQHFWTDSWMCIPGFMTVSSVVTGGGTAEGLLSETAATFDWLACGKLLPLLDGASHCKSHNGHRSVLIVHVANVAVDVSIHFYVVAEDVSMQGTVGLVWGHWDTRGLGWLILASTCK
jgi:hypothetical protein